jgi:hypothetical protein
MQAKIKAEFEPQITQIPQIQGINGEIAPPCLPPISVPIRIGACSFGDNLG